MLPPQLAHDELSLNQDVDRHSVTLWLTIEDDAVVSARHERTLIRNRDKTTYDAMRVASEGPLRQLRELLEKLSREEDPEDLVAWRRGVRGRRVASMASGATHTPSPRAGGL